MRRSDVKTAEMERKTRLFEESVHTWYDPLYRFAVSLCRDPDDAADLTQNAFYKLAAKEKLITQPDKIKSWLFSVVHREFIDQYRKRKRRRSTSLELVPEPQSSFASNHNERQLDSQSLLSALETMEDKYRLPLTLFYLEQFSYKEIAKFLHIPIGTVMSRLRRGKDVLRSDLENNSAKNTESSTLPFPRKEFRNG